MTGFKNTDNSTYSVNTKKINRLNIIKGKAESVTTLFVKTLAQISSPINILLDSPTNSMNLLSFTISSSALILDIYSVSIDFVESLTGIDFFPKLENFIEDEVEQKHIFKEIF
jgi:endonuclease G